MTLCRQTFAAAVCLGSLACGSAEPPAPLSQLILGDEGKTAIGGSQDLTPLQEAALKNVIVAAGAPCDAIERAYLDAGAPAQTEMWDVRCADGAYRVHVFADGAPANVQRCAGRFAPEWGCSERRQAPTELNPDLGRLLAPMTSKDGKVE